MINFEEINAVNGDNCFRDDGSMVVTYGLEFESRLEDFTVVTTVDELMTWLLSDSAFKYETCGCSKES